MTTDEFFKTIDLYYSERIENCHPEHRRAQAFLALKMALQPVEHKDDTNRPVESIVLRFLPDGTVECNDPSVLPKPKSKNEARQPTTV